MTLSTRHRPPRALPLVIAALLVASVAAVPGPAPTTAAPAPLTPAQTNRGLTRDVFGYLPYWELDSSTDGYLRYDLLTTIALFSFSYGADGSINQPWTYGVLTGPLASTVIAHAHAAGVRIELAFSFSGTTSVNDAFFNNAGAQATAISQTVALMRQLGADGVNLDVEMLSNSNFGLYGAFVKAMKNAVVAANPYGQVSVATNGAASGAWLAVAALGNGADRDFIMGYDYRTGGANPTGSIAPLVSFNGGPNLTATLDAYATRGVPMNRVVLGLPYYGRTWPTVDATLHSARNTTLQLPAGVTACSWNAGYPYFVPAAMASVPAGTTFAYDGLEQSAWFATYDSTAKTWCETYFDDPHSLSAKYDLALSRNVAGVGMWALGYDAGQNGYWQAIAAKFGRSQLKYSPLAPARILDTRIGAGLAGRFSATVVRVLQVAGRGGVPAGASAVTLNLTVVGQTAGGYLSAGPSLAVPPATSTLNFPPGDIRANGLTVPLAPDGTLQLVYMAVAGASTNVVADVTGYYR